MRKLVVPSLPPPKDDNGAYEKVSPVIHQDLSVDDLLKQGLLGIQRTLKGIMHEIATAAPLSPERDTVMSLKDVMAMLHELKKKEKDLLDDLTDEQLTAMVKNQ